MKPSTMDILVLRRLIRHNPDTGELFWRVRPREFFKTSRHWNAWNVRYSGKPALASPILGYLCGQIFKKAFKRHRVLWALHYGAWPAGEIDHINGDPLDNRISNLRDATRSENKRNRRSKRGSTSKYLGVSWCKRDKRWLLRIKDRDGKIHCGSFIDEVDAAIAYDRIATEVHGVFARLNFPRSL